MEIENSNLQGTSNINDFQTNFNQYADNSSNQTHTVSTKDNLSNVSSNVVAPNSSTDKKDLFKLCQLVLKERQALSNNNSKLISKPSFREIKNNVQIIQHNIDNFFSISVKKGLEKLKKDD
jgi:hypothetical protein